MKKSIVDLVAWILVVVGALNWGLVGAINFDLVATLFGTFTTVSRVIYALVGVAGLWVIMMSFMKK